jgi:hypothetical protein
VVRCPYHGPDLLPQRYPQMPPDVLGTSQLLILLRLW